MKVFCAKPCFLQKNSKWKNFTQDTGGGIDGLPKMWLSEFVNERNERGQDQSVEAKWWRAWRCAPRFHLKTNAIEKGLQVKIYELERNKES